MTANRIRAVQEHPAEFVMDWPAMNNPPNLPFDGTLFVLADDGNRVAHTPWAVPTDAAADQALLNLGWTRCGAWSTDHYGRRSAPLAPIHARQSTSPRLDSRTS